MVSDAQRRAIEKYRKDSERLYSFRLSKNTYPKLIEYLDKAENKQGLIKQSLIEKMKRDGYEID